jgi:L,D-peptidoglycan transpeptidase YkuD (ErfK/YbiS/YcfS/YnhG family)
MVQWHTCEHGDDPAGSVNKGEIRNSFLLTGVILNPHNLEVTTLVRLPNYCCRTSHRKHYNHQITVLHFSDEHRRYVRYIKTVLYEICLIVKYLYISVSINQTIHHRR